MLVEINWFRRYCQENYLFPEDLNPHCDLDFENSNPKLSHIILACDAPLYQVWSQKVQNFRLYGIKLFSDDLTTHCDIDLEDNNEEL